MPRDKRREESQPQAIKNKERELQSKVMQMGQGGRHAPLQSHHPPPWKQSPRCRSINVHILENIRVMSTICQTSHMIFTCNQSALCCCVLNAHQNGPLCIILSRCFRNSEMHYL
ncbi:hypothetical protein KC19_4G159200 [Ceratodon purpureus]|uniref:Uncharacterized protein n=1 Tax=Ceratodon purpureus TaxID=3225 RepID=A0A8T0IA17_CERPU|nr:hypothetical protein KC19_4G159200 [Ceratodon purpureus]